MATAVLIDLSNYDTLLVQSTQGRSGTPDGNIFFDTTSGKMEFITKQELAQVNLGSGDEDNPLDETLGIKLEAAYAFENQEMRTDEDLRKFDRFLEGNFKFAGAYNFINGREPATAADVAVIRGSGCSLIDASGVVQKIYFGNKGLSNIEATSQPYNQLSDSASPTLNNIAPTDFAKAGQIDEMVLVYEDGVSDTRLYEAVSVRTFGFNHDRKNTVDDLGIAELGGYSTGFALDETPHLTTGNYTIADVYTSQISPWTGMTLEKLASALTVDEFNEASGDFTWVLNNIANGSVAQMVAYLDAAAADENDIDSGSETITYGKRVETWYTYDAAGKVITRSGADDLGLYLYNVPVADQQLVIMTDDAGDTKTYPFQVSVEAEVGATAKADVLAWYHSFFAAAYNTAGAITVEDASAAEVKGVASSADGDNKIIFAFDYTGDTVGGSADTDKNCVFLCEGDGGATQAKTLYTITKITTVAFACIPGVENNS